jgi:hypothetical protein
MPTAPLLMQTPAEVAARDGISKQAVTKQVRKLADEKGLEVERDGRERIIKFNVAQYDHLRDKSGDPSKDQRPDSPEPDAPAPAVVPDRGSYTDALTEKTRYEAERRRLDLEEQVGNLVKVAEIASAVDECGVEIVSVVRRLSNEADALCTAIARDGAHGARVELKKIETKMLGEIAALLSSLAKREPTGIAEDDSAAQ